MHKRRMLAAAMAFLVIGILPALVAANDQETSARSKGAFLGIAVEPASGNTQQEGARVVEITPNSPAAKAGLKRGDVIVKAGDKDISDFEDLANALSQHKAGDKVHLELMRNGKKKDLTVSLAPRGRLQDDEDRGTRSYYGTRRGPTAFLGVQTEELTRETRDRQGLSAREGAVVTEVMPNTPAQQAGLREGDVITKVDDQPISNPQGLREAIQGAGHDVTIEVQRGKRARQLTARLEEGPVDFGQAYGASPADSNREIQRLNQRIQQLEQRIRNLEQSRQNQSSK